MPIAQEVLDAIDSHGADLSTLDDSAVEAVLKILNDLELSLKGALLSIDPTGIPGTSYRQARLEKLLSQTDSTIAAAYRRIGSLTDTHLQDIAAQELDFTQSNLSDILAPLKPFGISVSTVAVSPDILLELARNTVVNMGDSLGAAPIGDWLADQTAKVQLAYAGQIQRGIQIGEGIPQMVRRIVGSKGTPGVLDVPRYTAETLVRTSTQAVMSGARRKVYAANTDTVKGIYQITTRDDRTSLICLAYAGQRYEIDAGGNYVPADPGGLPYNGGVPRHPNCRSIEAPWTKSLDELGIDSADVPDWVASALDGETPDDIDGQSILDSLSDDEATTLLGPGRKALLDSGSIDLSDLVTRTGGLRTVADLQSLAASRA